MPVKDETKVKKVKDAATKVKKVKDETKVKKVKDETKVKKVKDETKVKKVKKAAVGEEKVKKVKKATVGEAKVKKVTTVKKANSSSSDAQKLADCKRGMYIEWRKQCSNEEACNGDVKARCSDAFEKLPKDLDWDKIWDYKVSEGDHVTKNDIRNAQQCIMRYTWDPTSKGPNAQSLYEKSCAKEMAKVQK